MRGMDDHHKEKKGIPLVFWGWAALLVIGIVAGVYIAPHVEPWAHPERAEAVAHAQQLQVQNRLLKEQVDCLVGGIQSENGEATLAECT